MTKSIPKSMNPSEMLTVAEDLLLLLNNIPLDEKRIALLTALGYIDAKIQTQAMMASVTALLNPNGRK